MLLLKTLRKQLSFLVNKCFGCGTLEVSWILLLSGNYTYRKEVVKDFNDFKLVFLIWGGMFWAFGCTHFYKIDTDYWKCVPFCSAWIKAFNLQFLSCLSDCMCTCAQASVSRNNCFQGFLLDDVKQTRFIHSLLLVPNWYSFSKETSLLKSANRKHSYLKKKN